MTAIVDYGVGNLFSLISSMDAIGGETVVTGDANVLRLADRIILPGVGAFEDAINKLKATGLDTVIKEEAAGGKPIMGICLGMQMLLDKSFEYGEHQGLGLIAGEVRPIDEVVPKGYKIPHIGWNALALSEDKHELFKYINTGDYVYFVHSYYGTNCKESVIATAEYGAELTAAIARGNVCGCQFHPEKSGDVGLKILKAFSEMKGE